ncbi:MAG: TauD/TfdA family dioxygenase, partial [Pseudomonadales bacterium]|nr:TauD/TfdA family dioxygenase [Pseudomonadales bacterium]
FTVKICGMKAKESDALLQFLYEHAVLPEHTCRFNWEPNSIAFWDNRITQHKPVNDYWPQRRKMQRITIDDGIRPV